ncbi:MAG TPA: DNA replication and repair protein RecF [Patescibacteria group bacterium]|nr:DNA replication and repair protein RecF [Patescibacteria group bacterium]
MIQKVRLQNFRNLPDDVFTFAKDTTVIVGPNAAGKTNLLESIFMLSIGKSFKSNLENEIIKEKKDFARIKGLLSDNAKLEVILSKISHKKFLVNAVNKRMVDFAGNLKTVLFAPSDLDLVTSSPSLRRKFLDNALSQVDREYRRQLLSYEKGLRSRNKLLFRIREEHLPSSQLLFWNQLLIKAGDYISMSRENFINFINENNSLSGEYKITYDKSVISEKRLSDYEIAEIASATTLVGPHRDDFIFQYKGKNLSSFGSRGEQRMGILWIKLSELEFIFNKTNKKPTLLLDDIFSELDEFHREIVFNVTKNQQTIITTADPEFLENFKVDEKIELGI